ncbi:MAG: HAD-IA family hydrolase [Sumerlaeia bacterium]
MSSPPSHSVPPHTIFFDAAFTVIAPDPSVGEVYARVAANHGLEADPAALNANFGAAFRAARPAEAGLPYGTTEEDARAFWRRIMRDLFPRAGLPVPQEPLLREAFDVFATRDAWRVYEDVAPAVERARAAGIRTGIMSNFDARLHGLLQSLEIRGLFDVVCISQEAGAEKPDPRVFAHARRLAGDPAPERLALIGDSPGDDLRGARAAGWRACLVDRKESLLRHDADDSSHNDTERPMRSDLVSCVEFLLA